MAQIRLGRMYIKGHGTPKDMKKTMEWYRRAAEKGNAKAQTYFGWIYKAGQGVFRDYKIAAEWYGKAANHRL